MQTTDKGLGLVKVCDYCGFACEDTVITIHCRSQNKNSGFIFCSEDHLRKYLGVEDQVAELSDRRFKKECNLIYKEVCPSCKRRLQKLL